MDTPVKPIFLLADSQLLFWKPDGIPFLQRIPALFTSDETDATLKAAYIGASNGDVVEFYDIFVAAMESILCVDCRMIPSEPSAADREYLANAHVILLAGGDVKRGWEILQHNGLYQVIMQSYYQGTVLMGVSAGAVQLGLKGWEDTTTADNMLFDTFQLIPYLIDVHDEPQWPRLSHIVTQQGELIRGLGVPAGGGAILYSDWSIEPIRYPLTEITISNTTLQQALLFPPHPNHPHDHE